MSDCGVCLTYDYDAPSLYSMADRKARKPHECCECHRVISPGEVYERVSGKWDGWMGSFATCAECADIATSLSCDGSRMHGGLWDSIDDLGPEVVGAACLLKLTTASAKAKLQAWWIDRKGLAHD